MRRALRLIAGFLAYAIASWAFFGDPFSPIVFGSYYLERLPDWLVWPCAAFAALLTIALSHRFGAEYAPALFLASMALLCGAGIDHAKRQALKDIDKDAFFSNSAINAGKNAPNDGQYHLHAAYLKNCRAYAWSHLQWGFYELPQGVARNVLPQHWYELCPNLAAYPR